MYTLLVLLHVGISVLLVVAVLIQSGRGAATANIFGGARAAENVFGASTPAILNKITAVLAAAFISTSVALTLISGDMRRSVIQRSLPRSSAPAREEPAQPPVPAVSPEPADPLPETP